MVLKRLTEILSLFTADRPELTPLEVANLIGLPRSTVYRLLNNIAEAGFLDFDEPAGRYRIGIRLASLGALAQRSTSLQRTVYPTLQWLSVQTQETATLMVRSGTEGLTIDVVESFQPLMVQGLLGGRLPLHASAGGKVLLAWLPEADRRALIRQPLKRYTAATITDYARFSGELTRVRDRGYSTVRGEWVDELFGAAAPVRNHVGHVVGAITVGGPRTRINPERLGELAEAAVEAASQASAAGGFSSEPGRRNSTGTGASRGAGSRRGVRR
jgi:DNA-binding IclR family transcriptional regulator